ncbi:hypothetical protein GMD78_08820 [Ornithinibacillus sp. L9]|uniref:Uncharacterized protein n=1 Tax=Ornithinibacillus caprae TaxID=2678566 RepID=A0A6N8FG84_9BACI|nr:hypothetical protein [Ornithinibacillus caprae]MUK88493.1 hypothetical protein [Ornithinibacillus caprae]
MPNYVPYLILTIVSITILSIMIVQKRQIGLTVLLLSFSGMVYIAEFFVMVIGNSYYYFPEVLSVQYYDHILGTIVSNLFVIPVLGVVAAVYQLRLRWLVLFAATLVGIECLFEWLNIYHANWWRKEYTFISILFFFLLSKFWMRALQLGTKWSRFLSLWMQGWGGAGTVMYIMSVVEIRHYEVGFFENIYRDNMFISTFMGLIKGLFFAVAIIRFQKFRWRLLAPILVYAIDVPLYYLGVLVVEIPFWIYTAVYLVLATLLLLWTQYAYSFISKLQGDV